MQRNKKEITSMKNTLFNRLTNNIEGIAVAIVSIWGSSAAFVFQK